jgi:hypothetical protein
MSRIDSLTQTRVRLTHATTQVSPERIQQAWAGVPMETHPAERKYLGVIHPITSKRYFCRGLPMGSGNSPSLARRHGNSFLRKVRECCPAFQGQPTTDTWWDEFSQRWEMNGRQCQGRFLIGKDSSPAAQVWAHCDNFLIHASTYEETMEGLRQFLETSVEVGILCHPGKLIPPAHVVKHAGFLFDSSFDAPCRDSHSDCFVMCLPSCSSLA